MHPHDPLSAGLPPSRHPFQVWVLAASVLAGLGSLLGADHTVVRDYLPTFTGYAWSVALLVGGWLGLVGAYWRDRVIGLLLERAGLTALAVANPIYGIVALIAIRHTTLVPTLMTIGVGFAAGWRVVHVTRELRYLRQWIETVM